MMDGRKDAKELSFCRYFQPGYPFMAWVFLVCLVVLLPRGTRCSYCYVKIVWSQMSGIHYPIDRYIEVSIFCKEAGLIPSDMYLNHCLHLYLANWL